MSLPTTDAEPLPKSRRSALVALSWGLACAVCAGGVSLSVFFLTGARIEIANAELVRRLPTAVPVVAGIGALGGLWGGWVVGLFFSASNSLSRGLTLGGVVTGAIGGGATLPTVIFCREWLSPLASSMVLWMLVGFFAGLGAYCLSRWMPESLKSTDEDKEDETVGPDPISAAQRLNEDRRRGDLMTVRLIVFLAMLGFLFLLRTQAGIRY